MKKKGKRDREKKAVCPVVVAVDEPEGYPEFECEDPKQRVIQH